MPLTITSLPTIMAALAVVVGLVLIIARAVRSAGLIRRIGGSPSTRRVAVQDTLALDRLRRLHVIRCDGREFVLLTGGTADLLVGWLPAAAEGGRS